MSAKRQLPLQLQKLPADHLQKVSDHVRGLIAVGLQEIPDLNALDEILQANLKGSKESPAPNSSASTFSAGQAVEIHSLSGAPEHNGKIGKVLRLDDASGRYVVELDDGVQKSFKPANLKVSSDGARKSSAGSSSEKVSSEKVKAARKEQEKQKAAQQAASTEAPKVGDFTVGDRVRVGGLNGAIELNGQLAVVFGLDKATGRYVLEFENGAGQRKLQGKNLTPQGVANGALAAKARMFAQMEAMKT